MNWLTFISVGIGYMIGVWLFLPDMSWPQSLLLAAGVGVGAGVALSVLEGDE